MSFSCAPSKIEFLAFRTIIICPTNHSMVRIECIASLFFFTVNFKTKFLSMNFQNSLHHHHYCKL